MATITHKALRRWLRAEREGDPATAERALATVLGGLPPARPSADFAARVLAATDLRLDPVFESRFEHRPVPWWARLAVAACVLLGALGLAMAIPTFLGTLQLFDPAEVVTTSVSALEALAQYLAGLGIFWDLATRLRESLVTLVAVPQITFALVLSLTISSLALRALTELLSPHRSPIHATP